MPDLTLRWPRPSGWESWRTLTVSGTGSTAGAEVVDCAGIATRVVFPTDRVVPPVKIINVDGLVVIGGSVAALPGSSVDGFDQRMIQVTDAKGAVHLEGLDLDGGGADNSRESDALLLDGATADFTVQNVRAHDLHGKQSTNHADMVQIYRTVKSLRVHNLTGTSDYQGLKWQLVAGQVPIGSVVLSNVDAIGVARTDTDTTGGYLLWMNPNGETPVTLDNVRVYGRGGRRLSYSVWPPSNYSSDPTRAAVPNAAETQVSWPAKVNAAGIVTARGPSDASDYVPAGSVGRLYTRSAGDPPVVTTPPAGGGATNPPPATAGALTVTPEGGFSPPRMRIAVTGRGSQSGALGVVRVASDGATQMVRQPVTLSSGGGVAYDYEAPLGVPVTYRTVETSALTSFPVDLPGDKGWLVHPFYPSLSIPLYGDREQPGADGGPIVTESADASTTLPSSSATINVLGREDPIVQRVGRRRRESGSLALRTQTRAVGESVRSLVDDDSALLLNIPPGLGWSLARAWILAGDVTEMRRPAAGATDLTRLWTLPFQVVQRPAGLAAALWTCADVLAEYATCQDVLLSYATCLDLEADQRWTGNMTAPTAPTPPASTSGTYPPTYTPTY